MEDYMLDFCYGYEVIMGLYMLEVDLILVFDKLCVEVYLLGIGGKDDLVCLVFIGVEGKGYDIILFYFDDGYKFIGYLVDCKMLEVEMLKLLVVK